MSEADWNSALGVGLYSGSADDIRDGFIHFSTADQLSETLVKHFSGQENLVLVAFASQDFAGALKWEPSRGGALFPHLYGEVDTTLARTLWHLKLDADGVPQIPADAEL